MKKNWKGRELRSWRGKRERRKKEGRGQREDLRQSLNREMWKKVSFKVYEGRLGGGGYEKGFEIIILLKIILFIVFLLFYRYYEFEEFERNFK